LEDYNNLVKFSYGTCGFFMFFFTGFLGAIL
jgi:hypothetical protein